MGEKWWQSLLKGGAEGNERSSYLGPGTAELFMTPVHLSSVAGVSGNCFKRVIAHPPSVLTGSACQLP